MEAAQAMGQQVKREIFDDKEEAFLLSRDQPAVASKAADDDDKCKLDGAAGDDFEFWVLAGGGGLLPSDAAAVTDMCAADEVFFEGQILPLQRRPSLNNGVVVSAASRGPSRCGSLSESTDGRCSTTTISSLSSNTSRSNSSNSSSRGSNCVSRSHSSSSTRSSLFNNFYAHPSPKPQLRNARKASAGAGRRSTSSAPAGWVIFRLGLVRAPQIELYDISSRRSSSSSSGRRKSDVADASPAIKKLVLRSDEDDGNVSARITEAKVEKKASRLVGRGFSCKSSLDAVEPVPAAAKVMAEKKKNELNGGSLRREDSMCRSSRIFEWLEELAIAKATGSGGGGGGGGGGGDGGGH